MNSVPSSPCWHALAAHSVLTSPVLVRRSPFLFAASCKTRSTIVPSLSKAIPCSPLSVALKLATERRHGVPSKKEMVPDDRRSSV
jgi:hypothetical protein